MRWLLWRQHQLQGAIGGGLIAVFAVLLWITGVKMAHTYHSALGVCRASGTCDNLNLFQGDGALINLVSLSIAVPLLVGVFWGATLIGRELETGTHTLVWTQGITRRAWLRGKLLTLVISSTVIGAAVSGLVTWWSGTLNSMDHNRFDPMHFDMQGVAPIAFTLFAAALGLASGVFWRRTLPAIATTVAGFFVVRLVVENYARPHYQAARTASVPLTHRQELPGSPWIIARDLTQNGHTVTGAVKAPGQCAVATRDEMSQCLDRLGYRMVTKYQPSGRYWTFQFIEAAIFVALAAILITAAVITLRRHDA
jgi:ABC-2 family transporter